MPMTTHARGCKESDVGDKASVAPFHEYECMWKLVQVCNSRLLPISIMMSQSIHQDKRLLRFCVMVPMLATKFSSFWLLAMGSHDMMASTMPKASGWLPWTTFCIQQSCVADVDQSFKGLRALPWHTKTTRSKLSLSCSQLAGPTWREQVLAN